MAVRLADRVGRKALHVLCVMLVAVTGALLLRPALLLLAAVGGGDVEMSTAVVALGYHLVLFALAVTLYRRTT